MTRDELRKIYTFLKKETGIGGVPSRNLGSKEECMMYIQELLKDFKGVEFYRLSAEKHKLEYRNRELEEELEKLKNRNWWRRLWNMQCF